MGIMKIDKKTSNKCKVTSLFVVLLNRNRSWCSSKIISLGWKNICTSAEIQTTDEKT